MEKKLIRQHNRKLRINGYSSNNDENIMQYADKNNGQNYDNKIQK